MKNIISLLFKKDYSHLYTTDIHSHLIPDIDDGVKTLTESMILIRKMQEMGFKKLITTPHIMSHRFPNTSDIIKKGFEEVQEEVIKKNIDIELDFAAEYYLDEHFLELIKKDDILSFGDKKYVLFEMSYTNPPMNLEQIIFELQSQDYTPVMAHPERYIYYRKENMHKLQELRDRGLLLQINVNSIGAFYGKKVKSAVGSIIDNKMVDFLGSDTHNKKYLDLLEKILNGSNTFQKVLKTNNIKNSLL